MAHSKWLVFTGSYTSAEQEGIETLLFDSERGTLRRIAGAAGVPNSSYLAFDAKRYVLYSVSEAGTGEVVALRVDRSSGTLTEINRQPSNGSSPCYICLEPSGERVYVSNYMGGNASVYAIREDGGLEPASDVAQHEGSGPRADRQEAPHAHSIVNDPSGGLRLVADLGIDKIVAYRTDDATGKLVPAGEIAATPGNGPRHIAFHGSLPFLYLLEELSSTVSVFSYDSGDVSASKLLQTVPMLPADFDAYNLAADIHLTPDSRFLYASNRGHDSLATYAVGGDGLLTFVGHAPVAKTPRNFAVVPDGEHLLVAGQDANVIDVMRIGENGLPERIGTPYASAKPVCIVVVPAPDSLV
jgi:6-phosphogluconolactonase